MPLKPRDYEVPSDGGVLKDFGFFPPQDEGESDEAYARRRDKIRDEARKGFSVNLLDHALREMNRIT